MKIRFSLGVLGPSGQDLAQGEFSFFSFAMVSSAQEVAPASFMVVHGRGPGWVLGGVARPFGMRRGNASEASGRVRALAGGALAGDDDEVAVRGGRKVGDRERPPV